jgi:20S proteasome alpha/beta subunit
VLSFRHTGCAALENCAQMSMQIIERMQVPYSVGGSGSAYISGFCEKYWEAGMTEEQCVDFCKRAVAHAFARDGSSGGSVRYVVITEQGARKEFQPHTETLKCFGESGVPEFAGFPAA